MFNWSSLMLFNNAKCSQLTPEYVNNAAYHELHQFKWVKTLDNIGELPPRWNHLVGYSANNSDVALVHWTQGAPHLEGDTQKTEFEEEWFSYKNQMVDQSML